MVEHGGQMVFDFDALAREEARARLNERKGAPLHFTVDYYPPAELDEAYEHWCYLNGHFDSFRRSHMWHRSITEQDDLVIGEGEHVASSFTAELRPAKGEQGPGELLHQMVCAPCQWHVIDADENRAVEVWHDHAFPGWRELPIVPGAVRIRDEKGLTKLARTWIAEHYPTHMQTPSAPIITERQPFGTRHVRGYSPWGGYDISSTALGEPVSPREETPVRRQPPLPLASSRPSAPMQSRSIGD